MKNFFQQYALAMVAVATIITFSAFKVTGSGTAFMTVPVYFHGDATNAAQVADESNWTIVPNGKSCIGVNLACMIVVDHTDLTGGQLDSAKVTLDAIPGASATGYIPEHIGGSGTPNPQIINRNN